MDPLWSKIIQRELVVPWSIENTYSVIFTISYSSSSSWYLNIDITQHLELLPSNPFLTSRNSNMNAAKANDFILKKSVLLKKTFPDIENPCTPCRRARILFW
jgi:hypothetical protein